MKTRYLFLILGILVGVSFLFPMPSAFPERLNIGLRTPVDDMQMWLIANRSDHPLFTQWFDPLSAASRYGPVHPRKLAAQPLGAHHHSGRVLVSLYTPPGWLPRSPAWAVCSDRYVRPVGKEYADAGADAAGGQFFAAAGDSSGNRDGVLIAGWNGWPGLCWTRCKRCPPLCI